MQKKITDIIKELKENFPEMDIAFSSIITANINKNIVHVVFPHMDVLKNALTEDFLTSVNDLLRPLSLKISFTKYEMPLLPYSVANSKHGNFIFFIYPNKSCFFGAIVRKNQLIDAIKNFQPIPFFRHISIIKNLSNEELREIITKELILMLETLQEKWAYMHPLFLYESYEKSLFYKNFFENILKEVEIKYPNARRFIGIPSFSLVNYKEFFEKHQKEFL